LAGALLVVAGVLDVEPESDDELGEDEDEDDSDDEEDVEGDGAFAADLSPARLSVR